MIKNSIKNYPMNKKANKKQNNLTIHQKKELLKKLKLNALNKTSSLNSKNKLNLTYQQRQMWLLYQMNPNSTNYTVCSRIDFKGPLLKEHLKDCIQKIIQKNTILKTQYIQTQSDVIQVTPEKCIFIEEFDLENKTDNEQTITELTDKLTSEPFNLTKEAPIRMQLIKNSKTHHTLIINGHHIAVDGTSLKILLMELKKEYQKLNKRSAHSPVNIEAIGVLSHIDYAKLQETNGFKDKFQQQLPYWKNNLGGELPILNLPTKQISQKSSKGHRHYFSLNKQAAEHVKSFCKKHKTTPFMFYMSVYYIILSRYTNQDDIIIGTPVNNRPDSRFENCIGYFVNPLAIRINTTVDSSFIDLLGQVNNKSIDAFKNKDIPFEEVVRETYKHKQRQNNINPIFQTLFTYSSNSVENINDELSMKVKPVNTHNSPLELSFEIEDSEKDILCFFEYKIDSFESYQIKNMEGHFKTILDDILKSPQKNINQLELMTPKEKHKILYEWNDTKVDYPKDKCIHELFEEQVKKTPNNPAVIFEENTLTYKELDEKSTQLAIYLQSLGVKPDNLVGLCIERSLEMVIGIFGILKAGGAYVPIDPEYPKKRIEHIIQNSKLSILLTQNKLKSLLNNLVSAPDSNIIYLDKEWAKIASFEGCLSHSVNSKNLAYVIYTSGSTGTPKGAMIEHISLFNRILWMQDTYSLNKNDSVLQKTPFSFDVSVWEFFWPLSFGAKLNICKPQMHKDPNHILETIRKQKISIVHFVPSMLKTFLNTQNLNSIEKTLKHIICSGESLPANLANKCLRNLNSKLHNLYGPTEATIDVTSFECMNKKATTIPIGKPISNTQMYILNNKLTPCPAEIIGDLYISGTGLTRGYLNQPELTKEKLKINPFIQNSRMYKTGDLAKYLPDGNIEYIGRIDHQVKIRGFRIELEEIEVVLKKHQSIKDAIVVTNHINNSDHLIAFIIPTDKQKKVNSKELASHLEKRLPNYMVPSTFIKIDKVPLTSNGKIDRKSMMNQVISLKSQSTYTPPKTNTEIKLSKIWEEVLNVPKVGTNDNFFELGGHSLLSMQIISRVNQLFSIELSIQELFNHPTIYSLSNIVNSSQKSTIPPINNVQRQKDIPLSFAQERLWFLSKLGPSKQYNMPAILKIMGDINLDYLQRAIDLIVSRHETLRTQFIDHNTKTVQVINKNATVDIQKVDLSNSSNKVESLKNTISRFIEKPFSFEKAPLFRMTFIQTEPSISFLGICMHHIISDGWSLEVLIKELNETYAAFSQNKIPKLAKLPIQYSDFSIWQKQTLSDKKMNKELSFWKEKLLNYKDLDLPSDFPRPKLLSGKGDQVSFKLDKDKTSQLKAICQKHNISTFSFFMTTVYVLLSRYSCQSDICIGMPTANRTHPDLENLVGFFVNTLIIRINEIELNTLSFFDLSTKVFDHIIEAQDNQTVPFEKVIDAIQPNRSLNQSPIFQVMVNNITIGDHTLKLGNADIELQKQGTQTSKYDLSYDFLEKESIQIDTEFNTDIFTKKTILRMSSHLLNIIDSIIENEMISVSNIELMSKEETHKILYEWNNTKANWPKNNCIHELFEDQSKQTPEKTALIVEDKKLTYKELDEKSTQLAVHLQSIGVRPETLIGLCIDRSLEMIIGILGVLKAGGAYVPIDPSYPEKRTQHIIKDSSISILLTRTKTRKHINSNITSALEHVINIDTILQKKISKRILKKDVKPNNLAYIIYTSGTTGKPKGVMIEHKNLVSHISGVINKNKINSKDNFFLFYNFIFDAAVEQICCALITGATLHIPKTQLMEETLIVRYLTNHKISILDLPPKVAPLYLSKLFKNSTFIKNSTLRKVILGGEEIDKEFCNKWVDSLLSKKCELTNAYGPTETTVTALKYNVLQHHNDRVPIGKPLENTQVYILNKSLKPQPINIPGELYIAGSRVSRGYLNQNKLTKTVFLNNPFSKNSRMYNTGDLAKYNENGEIIFLGRSDNQIKIRGYRVELTGIESVIKSYKSIIDCTVICKEINKSIYLIAFVVVHTKSYSIKFLKSKLQQELPNYMIPDSFNVVDKIPLSRSGKVDFNKLKIFKYNLINNEKQKEPSSPNEIILVRIWKNLLHINELGINDNFFEIGGNSLLALTVVGKINEQLPYEVTIHDIFNYNTVHKLNKHCETVPIKKKVSQLINFSKPFNFHKNDTNKLFLFHALAGDTIFYYPLISELQLLQEKKGTPKFKYIGLESKLLSIKNKDNFSKDKMVNGLIKLIKKEQPNGPYNLCGWSFGANLAYEVAYELIKLGNEINIFISIDSEFSNSKELKKELSYLKISRLKDIQDSQLNYFLKKKNTLPYSVKLPKDTSSQVRFYTQLGYNDYENLDKVKEINNVAFKNMLLSCEFTEQPIKVKKSLILKAKQTVIKNHKNSWEKKIRGRTSYNILYGDHWSILSNKLISEDIFKIMNHKQ
jgi:amino acid adenylation domain-containing protein